MKISGAKAIVKTLEKLGVTDVFGIPGGATLPLYDELANSKKILHFLVKHEQVAAHAADAYARVSGKVGVCLATSGPGATNLVTGIANAYMDSVPIVAITGQVPTQVIGTDAFQEADTTGITLPIVKHNYLITHPEEIPRVFTEAFHVASTGRPGPVVIDLPKDVQKKSLDFKFSSKVDLPGYKPTIKGHKKQIKQAVEFIQKSKKPILFIGGGIITSGASKEIYELATSLKLPVTWTLMGKGAFPDDHELNIGMIGMHGTKTANYAVTESDLLITVGARFDDRATGNLKRFAPKAKVIHIDIDPAEISKIVKAAVPIVGDAKTVLKSLLSEIDKNKMKESHSAWLKQIKEWKQKYLSKVESNSKLKPQLLVSTIRDKVKTEEVVITTGVGQNQMWAAQYFSLNKPRSFISSGGLGTMGFGLPASIGAQIAKPDSLVINFDGDGSFQMVLQDLATIARYNLPIKTVIINNKYLGMVRQWQELFYSKRYFAVDIEKGAPDFIKLAEAYGINSERIKNPDNLESSVEKMLNHDGPYLLDAWVESKENVFPMVPAGAALDEVIGGDE